MAVANMFGAGSLGAGGSNKELIAAGKLKGTIRLRHSCRRRPSRKSLYGKSRII
jgi:hypothetical protein